MTVQSLPNLLHFGSIDEPLWIEFDRRIGHHSMTNTHYHKSYEIYYLYSGERNFFIGDSVHHILPGDMVLIDSNIVHKTSGLSIPNHERVVLHFGQPFFNGISPEDTDLLLAPFTDGHPLIRLNLQERMHVEELLSSLLTELNECP